MKDWDLALTGNPWGEALLALVSAALAIVVFDKVFRFIVRKVVASEALGRRPRLAAFLRDRKFVTSIGAVLYLTITYQALLWVPHLPERMIEAVHRIAGAGFIFVGLGIWSQTSRIVNELYEKTEISRSRPIKGYLQGLSIVVFMVGFICVIAVLLNRSPLLFFSGLGAMTAVLLLVFKDSILSLVAGIQLTVNGLIRVGDWIEMPQFNADGDVVEIALHSVRVQNWDRTITVIPAHKFLENSFKNWRGMQEAGGRRIKRSVILDMNTIRFLSPEDIERLQKFRLLGSYLEAKQKEIAEHNERLRQSDGDLTAVNFRRLTNVGTFRAYLIEYLREHPQIHKNMSFMVRQLAPHSEGLPIELYVFTTDTRWAVYEGIQADIFDHILAVLPEFALSIYQKPTGQDLKSLSLK